MYLVRVNICQKSTSRFNEMIIIIMIIIIIIIIIITNRKKSKTIDISYETQ